MNRLCCDGVATSFIVVSVLLGSLSFLSMAGSIITVAVLAQTNRSSDDLTRGLWAGFGVSFGLFLCSVMIFLVGARWCCVRGGVCVVSIDESDQESSEVYSG
jgi:hypothetical protein